MSLRAFCSSPGTPLVLSVIGLLFFACDSKSGGAEPAKEGSGGAGGGSAGTPQLDPTKAPSSGCEANSAAYPLGTTVGSVSVGSRQRTFRLHVPPGYRPGQPLPLVLMLHGGGGNGEQLQTQSARMDTIADRDGFITVYPDGTGLLPTWNAGLCCGRAVQDGLDDVAFMTALVDHLQAELCTDVRRVFAAGMSNGGMMSHRLACELSQRIAAIAPVAGTLGVPECQPARPVPVLHVHGDHDGHVPWSGGEGCGPANVAFTSVPSTVEGWRVRNGCDSTTSVYFEQGDGRCIAFEGCRAPVVLCAIEGGGHSWPGGVPKAGVADCPADGIQSETFAASEVAWRFFQENPMPQ